MPIFEPPVADTVPPVDAEPHKNRLGHRLFRHYKRRACGRTVLKTAGVWETVDYPTVDQINAATHVFLGGHVYTVSDAIAAELTAAGYEVT